MKRLYLLSALLLAGTAYGQTRVTPCSATTPNNAICVVGTAPTVFTDNTPISLALSYRVEQRVSTSSTWTSSATGLTVPRAYIQNLAPGSYVFRMYANCTGCRESLPSNEANGTATALPLPQPNAPVITIAVVISQDIRVAPVVRILAPNVAGGPHRRGEVFGFVPVGRQCEGPELFKYRGNGYHRVFVKPKELWGTDDMNNLAAPCGPRA